MDSLEYGVCLESTLAKTCIFLSLLLRDRRSKGDTKFCEKKRGSYKVSYLLHNQDWISRRIFNQRGKPPRMSDLPKILFFNHEFVLPKINLPSRSDHLSGSPHRLKMNKTNCGEYHHFIDTFMHPVLLTRMWTLFQNPKYTKKVVWTQPVCHTIANK